MVLRIKNIVMKTKQIKFSNLVEALNKGYIGNDNRQFYKKELLEMVQNLTQVIESDGTIVMPEDYDDYYIEMDNDNVMHVDKISIVLHRELLTRDIFLSKFDENEIAKEEIIEEYEELSYDGLNFI